MWTKYHLSLLGRHILAQAQQRGEEQRLMHICLHATQPSDPSLSNKVFNENTRVPSSLFSNTGHNQAHHQTSDWACEGGTCGACTSVCSTYPEMRAKVRWSLGWPLMRMSPSM